MMPADRTERKPTAYELECAKACEWCAKGIRKSVDPGSGGVIHITHVDVDPSGNTQTYEPCTAPSRDAVIERLASELKDETDEYRALTVRVGNFQDRKHDELAALKQERDELRADKERLDWLEASHGETSPELIDEDPNDEDAEMLDGWAVYGVVDCARNPSGRRPVSATAARLRAAIDDARTTQQEGK